jgi:hypothetical protein
LGILVAQTHLLRLNWMSCLLRVVHVWVLVKSWWILQRLRSILDFWLLAELVCGWKRLNLMSSILIVLVVKLEGLFWWECIATLILISLVLWIGLGLRKKWWILREASHLLNWASVDILVVLWICLILVRILNRLALVIYWKSWTHDLLFSNLGSGLLMCQIRWWSFRSRNDVLASNDQLCVIMSKWKRFWLVIKNFSFCWELIYILWRSRSLNSLLWVLHPSLNLRLTENWLGSKLFSYEYFCCRIIIGG